MTSNKIATFDTPCLSAGAFRGRAAADRQAGMVYHYTTGNKLHLIDASGALAPTGAMIAPREKPVLWFSKNAIYEPTAIKLLVIPGTNRVRAPTLRELDDLVGVFRFALRADDPRLIPWPRLQREARIPPQDAMSMINSGMRRNATPADWVGVMTKVFLEDVQMQKWLGGIWITFDLARAIAETTERVAGIRSVSAALLNQSEVTAAWNK